MLILKPNFQLIQLFQMTEVLKAGVLSDEIDLGALAHNAAEQAEEFVRKVSTHFEWLFIPKFI